MQWCWFCGAIVCQLLPWWIKYLPEVVLLCSEPNFTMLAWVLPKLAYLSMLLILEVACTTNKPTILKLLLAKRNQDSMMALDILTVIVPLL